MNKQQRLEQLIEPLRGYIRGILDHNSTATNDRGDVLQTAADFVARRSSQRQLAELTFICTHNSRRSHFAHVWAQTAASFYGLKAVRAYSGGTQATACNVRTIRALRGTGLSVVMLSGGKNPHYLSQAYETVEPIELFSKVYTAEGNPAKEYAAMMCCSNVDSKCPVVAGAAMRIALHYDDPKAADNTPEEVGSYDERCLQIGCDMFYLMSMAQQHL